MNFSLLDELFSGKGYISTMVSATNSGDGSAYCSRPTDSFDVYIVPIACRPFVQEGPIFLIFSEY